MGRSEALGPERLEYHFAHEAFCPLAALLQQLCGGVLRQQITDSFGDSAYWDFEVAGEVLTLHYEVAVGTVMFNARAEGRGVLESLRPMLDVKAHPVLAASGE